MNRIRPEKQRHFFHIGDPPPHWSWLSKEEIYFYDFSYSITNQNHRLHGHVDDQGEAYNQQQKKADYLDLGGENFSTD